MNRGQLQVQDSADSVENLSGDTAFSLMSHSHRRAILAALHRSDDPLALADLAEEVTWRNSKRSMGEISSEEVEKVLLTLHHRHIPKLAEQGAVTHDKEHNTVKLTERGEELAAVQAEMADHDINEW